MQRLSRATISRREFLATSAAGACAALAVPAVHTAAKTDSTVIVGEGDFRYEAQHNWPQLPDSFRWQTTHNVAVDREGLLYVIHEGHAAKPDHPAIFVFDSEGRYVRSFGDQFQGGGHGIEVHEEDGQEFLYVCAYQQVKAFAKLDLGGETVWHKFAPVEAGMYAEGEASDPMRVWGRDRFMPTNFAFLPDGDFLLADGYGSFYIHRYDKDGNWKSSFAGPGAGKGTFDTPHGIWVDRRGDGEPRLAVTDRAHHTVQYLALDGKHIETLEGFGLPANVDTYQDLAVVPELLARVSILDADNKVIAHLGDDAQRIKDDSEFAIRRDEKSWNAGRFVHPHDACFDAHGNIFVAEWVASGRVTRLRRLA